MTLPDLLTEAARLMPERFRAEEDSDNYRLKLGKTWERIIIFQNTPNFYGLLVAEYACREEIEARGWEWECAGGNAGKATATVWREGDGPEHCHVRIAPTPAEALLTALIQAVEGERV